MAVGQVTDEHHGAMRYFVVPLIIIYAVFMVGAVIPAVLLDGKSVWWLIPLGIWALLCTAGGIWLLDRIE